MEKFKNDLKNRIILQSIYVSIVLLLIVFGVFDMVTGSTKNVADFISGFNFGICISVELVAVYYMTKYTKALNNEELLKKLYVEENDERNKMIQTKIGGIAIDIILGGVIIATIVAGYFNEVIFFTLLGVTAFMVLTKLCLKIYYNKHI